MEVTKKDNELIFALEGKIYLFNESQIKNDIIDSYNENVDDNIQNVIIDISKVTIVDSSGIGMLLYIFKFLKGKEKKLILKSVPDDVMKVLKLARINTLIEII